MTITLQLYELQNLLTDVSDLGAKKALMAAGIDKTFLTATEAYNLYGRRKVERWVSDGLIKPIKHGRANSRVQFDRILLDTISKTTDNIAYFNMPQFLKKYA